MFGYGYGCGAFGGGWPWMMLIPLLLLGVIIYAIFRFAGNGSVRSNSEFNSAVEVLNERFARGEINEDEYRQKKSLLLRH